MNRFFLLLCLLFPLSHHAQAHAIDKSLFDGYDAAFVLLDRSSGEVMSLDTARAAKRLPPCSTFKIYNTLTGLELGLIEGPDEQWYTWDGIRRDYEAWNRDLTLREAFRVSAVPAFQRLARRIGSGRMKKYIDRIGYGSRDTASGVDAFWLPREGRTSITISADEQVDLLRRLLDGELPFSEKNVAILRDVMKVEETSKGTLYGKTGSGMDSEGRWNLGWFVGFVESGGKVYVYACNIAGGDHPSGAVAREIVERVLRAKDLL